MRSIGDREAQAERHDAVVFALGVGVVKRGVVWRGETVGGGGA